MTVDRSYIMSRIRKTDTKPELKVRKFLFSKGYRYRLYVRGLPGNPDIVMPRYKVAIFINGCFWHAHTKCRRGKMPKSNVEYWVPKIEGNVKRDVRNKKELRKMGWKPITIWECDLHISRSDYTLRSLITQIEGIRKGK